MTWWWVDASFGCGGIATNAAGVVVDAAPIFRRAAMGRSLAGLGWARRRVRLALA